MSISFESGPYRRILFLLVVAAIAAVIFILPFSKRSKASAGLFQRTSSHEASLLNYDIRTDKSAIEKLVVFRTTNGKTASDVADRRDTMARGETALRQQIPTLKVEYNTDLHIPEVIAPDIKLGPSYLTSPATAKRPDVLRNFLIQNAELLGADRSELDELTVAADYTNPDGVLSYVELDQQIDGIPVFRGEVKAGFTRSGEMIRVINNFAPGLKSPSLSKDFGDPVAAVKLAAGFINNDLSKIDLTKNEKESTDIKVVFGSGDSAPTAEKMYFPTEPGVAVPAWRVLIWQPVNAYYVIVDAATGTMLWRKNITEDQTQGATYSVYANPNAMINLAHSPFPFSPGPFSPNGAQGAALSRTTITRVGNEPPYTFNQLGWLPDGVNITDGNNVQAGIDRDGTDGIDPNSEAFSSSRNFSFSYNPFNPNNLTGDSPVPQTQTYPGSAFQQGMATQLFYACNWYHDETYRLGFTEAARNFQNVNFTGQGVAGDRVRGEGQDSSGTNNANFSTPADGGRGRMQMYIFTGPSPNIDGGLDADVVIHEHTHGLSNRLHGNGSGIFNDMSRGLGEGWSDFYGMSMLSQPTDPIDGIYTTGEYVTYLFSGGTNNAYYGIRRFPTAIKTSVGPNGRPHDPLTFADLDSTQMVISDGAYSPRTGGTSDEVHNSGEIWCAMLWEIRARMVTRLGWSVGNRKALQLVTDGMKLAPLSPTYISERDAIVAAGVASGTAEDVADIWAGFATRGLGASASIQNIGGTSLGGTGTTRVTEAYDLPNLFQSPDISVSDAAGDNDGYPEPGETVSVTIPLTNSTGVTATGVSAQIVGGGSASYGTLTGISTVSKQLTYTIPAATTCGSVITITINITSSLGPAVFTRQIFVGQPGTTAPAENFDAVTAPAIPTGWTVASISGGIAFVTTATAPDSAPNTMFALDPTSVGGGTDLTSPPVSVTSAAATVTFRNKYDTESTWDGGVLEISIAGGPYQDILTAGGSFVQNGYNGTLGAGSNNPVANRAAWTGLSSGFLTTVAQLPAAANGKIVQLRWRFGADDNTAGTGTNPGWSVDTISLSGAGFVSSFACRAGSAIRSRADFDGDGKTDISIYRPSDGNWWVNRSTLGLSVVSFGLPTDIPTPGDFDGDGKADLAVFRPSNGQWYRINSGNGTVSVVSFGTSGDIPQPGDFDGDGKDDIALYRPSTGVWWILNSSNGQVRAVQFGIAGDLPVAGDYDGDQKDDVAVYRPSNGQWYRINSSNGSVSIIAWGSNGDMPVNADYDGDKKEDIAVYRPSNGTWYWINSSNSQVSIFSWGLNGDTPVPGDYNGDGRSEPAVYRNGTWFINNLITAPTIVQFGAATDVPIPSKYIPDRVLP